MPTYRVTGFANSSVGWGDSQIEASGAAIVSGDGLAIEVIDDDLIFDDESPSSGQTRDTSSQILGNSFGDVAAGQVIQSVYSWTVTNTTTGEVGTGYLLRIYNGTDPTNPGGQDGQYYQVFTIAVHDGDVLSYSPGNFVGQVAYADLDAVNVINGTPDDDGLIGTPGSDEINGFDGNDVERGRGGDDTLNGDNGHDFLIAGDGDDTVNGGDGDDYLRGGEGNDTLDGGAGYDRAAFTVGVNDPSIGETGIQTGATVDLNIQGVAQDTGHGMDTLIGIEHVSGTTYDDILTGNSGDNWIWGEGGNDTLSGGDGNDLVETDAGNSVLDGGTGNDTAGFQGADTFTSGVTVSLALQGSAQTVAAGSDITLTGFENLTGTGHDDSLTGDSADNILAGNEGDDSLSGGDGNDTLYGDGSIAPDTHGTGLSGPITTFTDVGVSFGGIDGDDTLEGGAGSDTLNGGGGSDTASYAGNGGPVEVNLQFGFADEYDASGTTVLSSDTLVSIENATGSAFNDFLAGSSGDNVLQGLGGNDTILGQAGNDTVDGGDGSDILRGDTATSVGNDILIGGDGDDHMRGGAGVDSFDGGTDSGGQSIYGGFGDRISFFEIAATQGVVADLRTGVISNDGFGNVESMTGIESLGGDTAYVDTFYGNDGRNTLLGGRGDNLYGFGGDDQISLSVAAAVVDGGDGVDLLQVNSAGGWLMPDADADGIAESAGAATEGWFINLLNGTMFDGYGNFGTVTGIENVDGSELADTIRGDNGNNVLRGLGGDDFVVGNGGDDTVEGGDGSDILRGDAANYTGGPFGNDTLLGGDGDDLMRGSAGVDFYDGGSDSGGESIYGGFGDRISFFEVAATQGVIADLRTGIISNDGFGNVETMVGIESLGGDTAYVDTFYGNDERNTLLGGRGDNLYGFGGDDQFSLAAAAAVLDGGDGIDLLAVNSAGGWLMPDADADGIAESAAAASSGWTVNLAAGTLLDGYGNSGTVTGIENVDGSELGDTLVGDDNANVLNGNDGDDTLEGGAGSDLLDGGAGAFDLASYEHNGGRVEVYLQFGFADEYAADGVTYLSSDTLANIENALGSNFDDLLFGSNGDNVLVGLEGHDNLIGLAGNDVLYGGGGNDTLRGDQGNNVGAAGNDILVGGGGNDFLNGGFGDDTLLGSEGIDRATFYTGATGGVTVDLNLQGVAQNTGQGMDTLIEIENVSGTVFADTLIGDNNDNWLWGSPGTLGDGSISPDNNDTLNGGGGNDLLTVGIGNHSLTGGTGTDTVSFTENGSAEPGIIVSLLLQGGAQATGAGSWTLTGIENLSGGLNNDALTGDGNDNVLAGDAGNDSLVGGAGNDTLYGDGRIAIDYAGGPGTSGPIATFADGGANGNDLLEGGLGNDTLNGGGGTDTATYAHASGGVNVNLGAGFANGADGNDTLADIENVTGSEFDDTLNGSAVANVIEGLGGADFIQGQGGNDTIYGGDGDDVLRGDAGENSLSVSGDDVIYGGNGNDGLRGGLGNDQLFGGANNDLLRGNGGVDYYDGGTDDGEGFNGIGDRVSFFDARATQGAVADLRTGVISNDGYGNVESMVGIESLGADTAFVDTFYGNDGRNFLGGSRGDNLYGFGGDDLFQTGSAAAVVDGGSGIDLLQLDSSGGWLTPDADADGLAESAAAATAGWTVNLAAGTTLDGYGNAGTVTGIENVNGSTLGDTLIGDANVNVLNGGDGNDVLNGRGGNDTLDGGNGTDTVSYANASGPVAVFLTAGGGSASGADGDDVLTSIENVTGSAFNDAITGNGSDNLLQGGDGHDSIRGGGGNDTVEGGAGDDFLRGDAGDDVLRGGTGFDRAGFASSPVGVTVNLSIVGPQATGQGNDTFEGIENVSGTQFNDTLTGDGGDNWLWGGSNGAGITGNDTIDGGGGNDLIEVGAGTHTLNGGAGAGDTLSLFGNGTDISSAGITYSLALQGAAQNTEQGMMNTSGFENVSGSIYDDFIYGNTGNNVLAGDVGNDTLRGDDGNDILYGDGRIAVDTHGTGGSGPITTTNDITTLSGDPGGNDTMLGGRGDDWLYGGRGNDTMTGNQGIDRYVIETGSGTDHVTDFAPNVDKVVFSGVAGVDDFGDLTLTKVGNNTVITWGTGDSLILDGVKPSQLHAIDFEFTASAAAFSEPLVSKELVSKESVHDFDVPDLHFYGAFAAAQLGHYDII